MDFDNKKVLVGVSGGVDSSVCVDLLRKQGYKPEGVVIRFSDASDEAVRDAEKVRQSLGITLHIADAREDFDRYVVHPFCQSYVSGSTPNPCIMCNPNVKFATLIKTADRLGIHYIATGHYAQVEEKDGFYYVKKAASTAKDQSYMLYRLPQNVLSRLLLPIGAYEKPVIRDMARDIGLFNADKPDSQEICFIPDGDYDAFIRRAGYKTKYGWIISPEGKRIKRHDGVHNYTVGQRKGLGVALGKPAFVKRIQENGDVLLGYAGDEFFTRISLDNPVYTTAVSLPAESIVSVKIRSAAKGEAARVIFSGNDRITLEFIQPVRAPAKGQSAVLYDGEYVLGGGFISEVQ